MTDWIKCSTALPEDDTECWICNKEKNVDWGVFEKEKDRCRRSEGQSIKTIEPAFRLDDEYCCYWYLDSVEYWMPYFTPEPPK